MVQFLFGRSAKRTEVEAAAQAEAPEFERVTWWKDPGLRQLYLWCAILMIVSVQSGYDSKLMNTSQVMDQWETFFDHPSGGDLGLIVAMLDIGSLTLFWIVPYIADSYGRKTPLVMGNVVEIIGALLAAFANGRRMYMAGRFVLGLGSSFVGTSALLTAEIAHPQHRAKVTAIRACMYGVGSSFCSWIALAAIRIPGDWSWRSLTFLQVVPSMIVLCVVYWIPESPRYHISKEKYEIAENMLAKYHGNGDKTNTTVAFEFREIKQTLAMEFEAKKSSSYLDFFRTPGNRHRVLILLSMALASQYGGINLTGKYANIIYESAGIKSQDTKTLLSAGQSTIGLTVSVIASMFIDQWGRRPLFMLSTSLMCLTYMGWTIIASRYERTQDLSRFGYPQVAFIWAFAISHQIAWSGVAGTYSLEIVPYNLRAKSEVIHSLFVRILVILGSYTNPIAWDNFTAAGHAWVLAMIYTILNFCYFLQVYFFYPETKNLTLEEIAKVFDGTDAAVAHVDIQEVQKELNEEQHTVFTAKE